MRLNQRYFVWLILALCVASIPVAFLAQSQNKSADGQGLMNKLNGRLQVIHLAGMIIDKPDTNVFASNTGSSREALKDLKQALKDDKIKGVLLRINSPGGTVPTSQELHQAVLKLKEKGKPVVVSMGDLAASGGYYVACAADKIVANPGTLTGSIGVIMSLINFKNLGDKLGLEPMVVKSGQFKDIASPYRPMTDEERKILTGLIMDSYAQFTEAVSKGRNLNIAVVRKIADGRIYSGRQAKDLGLVDQLGSQSDALTLLQKLCKEKYKLSTDLAVDEEEGGGFLSTIFSQSQFQGRFNLPATGAQVVQDLLPAHLNQSLNKQPLWLYQ